MGFVESLETVKMIRAKREKNPQVLCLDLNKELTVARENANLPKIAVLLM